MKKGDSENNKKVKIFNQSWGSTLTAKDEREIYADKKRFREELLKAISLKTTGNIEDIYNSGKESLTFYEEAINADNALFIWSNGNLDLKNQTLSNAGLQAAAPRVSNAAIQVATKFPWMTNNDVRMTLFTTTNKVGVGNGIEENKRFEETQADYKNGWGVLNTERALKGPGAFLETLLRASPKNLDTNDWNYYFNANIPKNTISYFENNIHGDSGVKKKGEGTW